MHLLNWHYLLAAFVLCPPAQAGESTCYGMPSNGRLEGGVSLPNAGANFQTYGRVPSALGRTHVHTTVRDTLTSAYKHLEAQTPGVPYVFAESGWATGGSFKPHKTHQNGLSVDLMVPVRRHDGTPVPMPTHAFNRYGYDIEFDARGRSDDLVIDFDALGALMLALADAARANGIGVRRVIFAPDLQPALYASVHGEEIRRRVTIPKKRSWVRHDEHIHVDFSVPCQPLSKYPK